MIFEILFTVAIIAILCVVLVFVKKQKETAERLIKLAMKVAELDVTINRVDESTGTEIHNIREEIDAFNRMYGEAAIEEKRQAAKAEKAWADGLNSIMSYGASHYGRGDNG